MRHKQQRQNNYIHGCTNNYLLNMYAVQCCLGLQETENLPLRGSKLSFYDDFHIMSGIPVFVLDPEASIEDDACTSDAVRLDSLRPSSIKISFFENGRAITCCSFSFDDAKLATGHNDGSAMIWSSDHGTVLNKFNEMHKLSPIADIRFIQRSNQVVVTCDFHGVYAVWDVSTTKSTVAFFTCQRNWKDVSFVSPTICWPHFSADSKKLVYPITHYQEYEEEHLNFDRCCSLFIFSVQDGVRRSRKGRLEGHCPSPQNSLLVRSNNDFEFASCSFSNSNKGLLAGFHAMPSGFSIFWSNLGDAGDHGIELLGTLGCWSQFDDYIATWDITTKGSLSGRANVCYIWTVDSLKVRTHMKKCRSTNNVDSIPAAEESGAITLSDVQGGNIFWVEFVQNLHDSLGIAACVVHKTVDVILWDVETQTMVRRLSTGISRTEIKLTDIAAWDDRWVHVQRSYGLKPLSMSGDGRWLGIFAADAGKGIIWNVNNGTEVVNFAIPENHGVDYLQQLLQMDMLFAESGGRFALYCQDVVLLWNVPALGNSGELKGVNRVALSCKDSVGPGRAVCRFSYDGRMVGLCRAYSLTMMIWNLDEGWSQTLSVKNGPYDPADWDSREQYMEMCGIPMDGNGRRFCLFAFSQTGDRLATCMGDMKILLWHLGKNGEEQLYPVRIAGLRSNYIPAWEMGFTVDVYGRETIAVCEDLGVLLWIDIDARKIEERQHANGDRRAQFSQDGTRAVLMPSNNVAHVWDLVHRVQLRTITYDIWLGITGPVPFPFNMSMDGSFSVAGISLDGPLETGGQRIVKCEPTTREVDLQALDLVPRGVHLMEMSDWVVIDSFCEAAQGVQRSKKLKERGSRSMAKLVQSSMDEASFTKIPSATRAPPLLQRATSIYNISSQSVHPPLGYPGGSYKTEQNHFDSSSGAAEEEEVSENESSSLVTGLSREFASFLQRSRKKTASTSALPTADLLPAGNSGQQFNTQFEASPDLLDFPELSEFFTENTWKYLLDYGEETHIPSDSLTFFSVSNGPCGKVVEGKNLLANKFIATSADGCRVACLSNDNQLIVWTPFACKGMIPDWNDLEVSGMGSSVQAVETLLKEHGPGLINYPDYVELTNPFHAVLARDASLLCTLVSWAIESNTKMVLDAEVATKTSKGIKRQESNVLDLAVAQRAPECVEVLLTNIPRGLGTVMASASIYRNSLSSLCRIFPRVFYRIISGEGLLVPLPEIRVPENLFSSEDGYKVTTSDSMCMGKSQVNALWADYIEKSMKKSSMYSRTHDHETKMVAAVPKVVLYPDIAQVGKKGWLRHMSMLPRHQRDERMYGSFLTQAVIHCKWKQYGHQLLIEEMCSFLLLWVSFTLYALILGGVWKLVGFAHLLETGVEGQKNSLTAAGFLSIAWVLGLLHGVREVNKFVRLYIDDGFNGLLHWTKFMWNWLSLGSYVMLVLFIGPLHFYIAAQADGDEGDDHHLDVVHTRQTRLTVLVAVECILLSWKSQNFAQAFRATAAIIIMIREILKSVFTFLVVAFLLLFGFAIAFFVLFRKELKATDPSLLDDDELERYYGFDVKFGTIYRSMVTAFIMMLGETQIETFYEMRGSIKVVGIIMCIVYLLAMMVVLLNLLIAVMGDSFERVKNNEEIQFVEGRADVIFELESLMSERKKEKLSKNIGKYLHVLVQKTESNVTGEWKGRLIEQNKLFKLELDRAMDEVKSQSTLQHRELVALLKSYVEAFERPGPLI